MTGATTNGWPYVTPTDNPKNYPATSQALANKLEADVKGLKAGYSGPVTTDGSGFVTITHTLGRVPVAVLLTPGPNAITGNLALAGWKVTSMSATTFTVFLTNSETKAAYPNVAFGFYWLAI
jgi:hypothetical protein